MMWNGFHLILSPAASHSGWEDHWQCDQYHYLHHSKFECNYGTGGMPWDYLFGTCRFSFDPKEQTCYKGGYKDDYSLKKNDDLDIPFMAPKVTKTNNYRPIQPGFGTRGPVSVKEVFPRTKLGVYMLFTCVIFVVAGYAAAYDDHVRQWYISGISSGYLIAAFVAFGPVAFAFFMSVATKDKYSWRFPFHDEGIFGPFSLHVIVGTMVSSMPIYHILTALLVPSVSG